MASHKKRVAVTSMKRTNTAGELPTMNSCQTSQKLRTVSSPHGQDFTRNSQGSIQGSRKDHGPNSSVKPSNQKAAYDAARITQWAEASAADLPPQDYGTYLQNCSTYGDNLSLTTMAPSMPGNFSFSCPNVVNFQPNGGPLCQPYGDDTNSYISNAANAEARFARMDIGHEMPLYQGVDLAVDCEEQYSTGLATQANGQFDCVASTGDVGRFDSMQMHAPVPLGNTPDFALPAEWENQMLNGFPEANVMGASSYSVDLSSPLALTPSTSSLPSDNSLLEQQLETPLSTTLQDLDWTTVQSMPMAGQIERFPPVTLESDMQVRFAVNYMDSESTLRPKQGFQRAPLSTDLWATQDSASQAFGLPPYPGMPVSRRSSEGENRNARDHPYYKAEPSKEDGLYHCPDPNKDGCTKAEKLKCNYDKHLDSHLKPYRCKSQGCAQAVFSSTACLLRHEREAHSMHGHGNKPHLCHFQDCERAAEDNGFPRRWNLFDHMKRVHDYDPSNKSNSPSPSSSSPPPQDAPRKRRTPSPIEEVAKKRTKVSSPQTTKSSAPAPAPMQTDQQRMPQAWNGMSLEQIRNAHVAQMQARLRTMDQTDPCALEQHNRDYALLQAIDQQRAEQLFHRTDSRL